MKRKMLLLCATTVMMANSALALEFRQMGNFGMGRAGVARTVEGTAADWKLGKLTFGEEKTDIEFGRCGGHRGNDLRAGSRNRQTKLTNPTTGGVGLAADIVKYRHRTGQATQLIGIMGNMQQKGNNSVHVNGDATLGARIRHFATGIFGTQLDAGSSDPDLINIKMTGV